MVSELGWSGDIVVILDAGVVSSVVSGARVIDEVEGVLASTIDGVAGCVWR